MTEHEARWLWVNGGGVVYHDHLYSINHVNNDRVTCTLISLPYEWLVFNVPIKDLTPEEEYEWNDD